MSIHAIEIIEIGEIEPHPNADRMQITHIWGWQCCIGINQFKRGDKAVYIPPDFLVPLSHPSFKFLLREDKPKEQERIRVRRFRGHLSQGLLIQVPDDLKDLPVGENVIEQLGIERYEPPLPKSTGADFIGAPSGLYCPKFDVENLQRYNQIFKLGQLVVVTEKIHGANARFTFAPNKDGELVQFCGSRTNWLKEDERNIWWMAFHQDPGIGKWCESHPGQILYGEIYGQVQGLKYGAGVNDIFFVAFAVLDQNRWLDYEDFAASTVGIDRAPVLYRGPFDLDRITKLAENDSYVATWHGAEHMAEGVVILPEKERTDPEIGRVMLKMVSNRYLEKGK